MHADAIRPVTQRATLQGNAGRNLWRDRRDKCRSTTARSDLPRIAVHFSRCLLRGGRHVAQSGRSAMPLMCSRKTLKTGFDTEHTRFRPFARNSRSRPTPWSQGITSHTNDRCPPSCLASFVTLAGMAREVVPGPAMTRGVVEACAARTVVCHEYRRSFRRVRPDVCSYGSQFGLRRDAGIQSGRSTVKNDGSHQTFPGIRASCSH